MKRSKTGLTASVVCYNEAHLLDNCLSSLRWCNEIIVIDIGSTDNSVDIAQKYTSLIYRLPRNPVVETYKIWVQNKAKHKWILYVDPDEVLAPELAIKIQDFLTRSDNCKYACVALPWRFHFKGRPLKGTWGYVNSFKKCLVHVDRSIIKPLVHYGAQPRDGYELFAIKRQGAFLDHYWMHSYYNLFSKHFMYLTKEAESRYNKGFRTDINEILNAPKNQFKLAYHKYQGYRDGKLGLFLSIFWAFYQTLALIQLLKYQIMKK